MIPAAKRIIEIGIAFSLIYTAIIWIVFEFVGGSGADQIYGALHWWFPGIFLVVGVATFLVQLGERRTRYIFSLTTIYGAILLYASIGYTNYLNLFFSFIVGALLVTGSSLLLIRPSIFECPHCGMSNPEKHEFCWKCGNKLRP